MIAKPHQLPPAEHPELKLGFMRLSDSAPLILAKEAGIYERYGLQVQLAREVSWANLRDKLVVGDLDAAQLLAPLPIASALGIGGIRGKLLTGLCLSLNGNAITVANTLWERLGLQCDGVVPDALAAARALTRLIEDSRKPLSFATVHAFSMHTYLMRQWLRAGGIDPDRDIRLIVLPPEQMCDSLARGLIDGFCVGEPWSSVAVAQGIGSVAATGYQIWNNAPEKILGVTEHWHNHYPATHLRLRMALMEASRLLVEPGQRENVAEMLSRREYLNLPVGMLLPSLTGNYCFSKGMAPASMPDFHVFWRYQAGFPWRSQAEWMVRQTGNLIGKPIAVEQSRTLVQQIWRTDLYREAARALGVDSPSRDAKPENLHGRPWQFEQGIELGADHMLAST